MRSRYQSSSRGLIVNSKQVELELEDLEEERFDRFPGEFYFQSFTKEYARSLGLNPQEVITDLQASYEQSFRANEPVSKPSAEAAEDGLLSRIAGYLRGAQEV